MDSRASSVAVTIGFTAVEGSGEGDIAQITSRETVQREELDLRCR